MARSPAVAQAGRHTTFDDFRPLYARHNHQGDVSADDVRNFMARLGETLTISLVDPELILEVESWAGCTVWLIKDENTFEGVNLSIPLSREGVADLLAGRFSTTHPERRQTVRSSEPLYGVYHWGFAGLTKAARRSIMQHSAEWVPHVGAHVPIFARGATEQGVAAILSLGLAPQPNPIDGLFAYWPSTARKRGAV